MRPADPQTGMALTRLGEPTWRARSSKKRNRQHPNSSTENFTHLEYDMNSLPTKLRFQKGGNGSIRDDERLQRGTREAGALMVQFESCLWSGNRKRSPDALMRVLLEKRARDYEASGSRRRSRPSQRRIEPAWIIEPASPASYCKDE